MFHNIENNTITLIGRIGFDPENKNKKHISQSSWKRIAMIYFKGDICQYYAWFIKKRYRINLQRPLRYSHVSFINDSIKELSINNTKSMEQIDEDWNKLKNKWDNKKIEISLNTDVRSNGKTWWLNLSEDSKKKIKEIRSEVGLGDLYFGEHMTIGIVNDKFLKHSEYILDGIRRGLID